MKYYVFAKFFQHLPVDELMVHCAEAGVDGPTAVIRDGYWLEPHSYVELLPGYVKAARDGGLQVEFADTSFAMEDLARDSTPLETLADSGITAVRLGYIARNAVGHVRDLADHARRLAEKTAVAAEKAGIKAVIQVHGGFYPHNATAAWPLVKDLNPRHIGIMIDPGNNIRQEGFEAFEYQIPLLGEYIAAVGAKDACTVRKTNTEKADKGWLREWAPMYEGQANWTTVCGELRKVSFPGPMVLMPFYDTDDFAAMFGKFKREVEYLRHIVDSTGKDTG